MAVTFLREFYNTVIPNEIMCHQFLIEKGLLKSVDDNFLCHKCGTEMQVKLIRNALVEYITTYVSDTLGMLIFVRRPTKHVGLF